MALAATASGIDNPLAQEETPKTDQLELNFRDCQLLKLRENILNLDDLSDNVVMSDFTMDYFLAQLRQYLEKTKPNLHPSAAYAITHPKPANNADPGVIFLLRQTNAQNPNPRQRAASLVHPFSLVYIKNDGTIRYGCASIRQTLELFEKIAISQTEPTLRFCDWFDHKTAHGKKMQHYNNLLKKSPTTFSKCTTLNSPPLRSAAAANSFSQKSPSNANDLESIAG